MPMALHVPDLDNLIVAVVYGVAVGFGWTAGAWVFHLLCCIGRVITKRRS